MLWTLVATQPRWIYRRVETIELIAERRVRREMSVDCRLPPAVAELADELSFERFVIPLRFVMRQSLLSFDLRMDDVPIPLLTRDQNMAATATLLTAAIEDCDRQPDARVREQIARVADADVRAGEDLLALLGLDTGPEDPAPEVEMLRWAVSTFDANYLLLTDVPLDAVASRAIFKITQEMPAPIRVGSPLTELRARVAWDPMSILFDTPDVTTTGSYHFQFVAPNDLTISGGTLLACREGDADAELFGGGISRTTVLGLNTHASQVPEADSYVALVQLRPAVDGLLRASAVSAGASTLLLLIATAVTHRLDATRADSSTTLLLVIPGILSTFLARPGEHSTVAQALRGVRALTLSSAVIVYVAAALLVLGVTGTYLQTGWLLLALLSAVPTAVLWAAVARCRPPAPEERDEG